MIEITHASLFSGIGGFDIAAEIVGFKNLFTCEKDDFCNKILKYYWPNIEHYGDIKTTDFTIWRGKIDILTGGFPCQPFSLAGKRKGTEDDRYLWPEMLRAISEIQPGFIIGENVYGIVNWDGGLIFDQVQSDLEAQGYEIIPIILPACAVNAPHRRDRVWFIAANRKYIRLRAIKNSNSYGRDCNKWKERSKEWRFWNISTGNNEWVRTYNDKIRFTSNSNSNSKRSSGSCPEIKREWRNINEKQNKWRNATKQYLRFSNVLWNASNSSNSRNKTMCQRKISSNRQFFTSNTISARLGGSLPRNTIMLTESFKKRTFTNANSRRQPSKEYRETESRLFTKESFSNFWSNFPTQSPICDRNDGISDRLVDITFPKWRNESIKAMGNAIVPEVAVVYFKIIEQIIKDKLLC